jgi:hypothetical protein
MAVDMDVDVAADIDVDMATDMDVDVDANMDDDGSYIFGPILSYPVPRNRERSLHTCAQDVQITRMATI